MRTRKKKGASKRTPVAKAGPKAKTKTRSNATPKAAVKRKSAANPSAAMDAWAALAADVDAIPAAASPHLQAVEDLIRRLPRPMPKMSAGAGTQASVPDMYLHEGLRQSLVGLVQRSRASWSKGDDFGLVNTLVGRLEFFPKYKRSELSWHK